MKAEDIICAKGFEKVFARFKKQWIRAGIEILSACAMEKTGLSVESYIYSQMDEFHTFKPRL